MRTKRRDDRLVSGEGICRPRHRGMLRKPEARVWHLEARRRPSDLSRARNPKEAEAPLGCSLLHLKPFSSWFRCSASGAVGCEPKLTASLGPSAEAGAARLSPRSPCDDSFGRIRCRTLAGFHPDPPPVSLRRPHRVAPLRDTYIATPSAPTQARSLVRFRELRLLFAGTDCTSMSSLQDAQNPEEARPWSRPLGVCSEVTMSLQSGSQQSPTSSRGVPSLPKPRPRSIRNCLFSPEAEASFDPRPHLGAEAP